MEVILNDSILIRYNALNLNHDNYEAFKPGDGVDDIDGRGGYDEVNYTDSPSWYDNRSFSINYYRWLG